MRFPSAGDDVPICRIFASALVAKPAIPREYDTARIRTPIRTMENKLYELYRKRAGAFEWFQGLDPASLRFLMLSTWYIMLWNPKDLEQKLLRFYGHVIDGPRVLEFLEALKLRYVYCDKYAWAVPNEEAIEVLREHSPIVEVGAGRGYWARLAASAGADVLAFDPFPPDTAGTNRWHRQPGTFFRVARGDAEVAAQHPDRTLFLCWPPYGSDVASRAIKSYAGETIIYVGDEGSSAGSAESYAELAARFTRVRVVKIPQWPGIEDRLEVWRRKGSGDAAPEGDQGNQVQGDGRGE